jgi:hypothetical protein
MPIRVNLLAEAQAQEDLRRRDPVKRVIIAGSALVALMLVWSISLWLKSISYKGEVANLQKLVQSNSDQNKEVLKNQKQTGEVAGRLAALQKLSRDRLLVGTLLDAMQRITVPEVQLVRLRLDDTLTYNEEIKASLEAKRAAKPASVTERISISLDAKDASAKPGDLIPKFQQAIADASYFAARLDKSDTQRVHLKPGSYGTQQVGPDGRPFQPFTLDSSFPEKTR